MALWLCACVFGKVMLSFLSQIGVKFEWSHSDSGDNVLSVRGTGGHFTSPASIEPIYLGNAGTAARFLTSFACLLPDP